LRKKSLSYLLLTLLLVITSILSIWSVSKMFGDGDFLLSFSFLSPTSIASIIALLFVYFLFDSLRFYYCLRTLDIRLSFLFVVKLSFIGVFVTAITPFATGGGFAQVYFLVRQKVPLGSAVAASTMRTLLGFVFFLIAAPLSVFINPALIGLIGEGYSWIFTGTFIIFSTIIIFLLWIVIGERSARYLIYKLMRFCRRRRILSPHRARKLCLGFFSEVRNFAAGIRLFLHGPKKYIGLSILFTLLFLFTLFSIPMLLTRVMGYGLSPLFVYQSMIVITFMMNFAVTPGASGIAEAGFAMMFSNAISSADIDELTLLWRSLSVYAGVIIGMVVFYYEVFMKRKKAMPNE